MACLLWKQNNQSTTHIDPQVGIGGMVRVYTVKSDTLNLVDISMSNCTSSWQLLGVLEKSLFVTFYSVYSRKTSDWLPSSVTQIELTFKRLLKYFDWTRLNYTVTYPHHKCASKHVSFSRLAGNRECSSLFVLFQLLLLSALSGHSTCRNNCVSFCLGDRKLTWIAHCHLWPFWLCFHFSFKHGTMVLQRKHFQGLD